MIRQRIEVSESWPTFLVQEPPGQDVQCLHDDQTKYKMRNGLPETYPFFFSMWITMTREWQEWLFEQFRMMQPNWTEIMLKKAWAGWIKDKVCVTDGHAPQNGYCDFINEVNMGKPGFGHRTLSTGGNHYHLLGGPFSKGGVRHWQVEAIDTTKPPPDIKKVNRFTRPDLIGSATVRTKITLPNGLRRVDPAPQLGGADLPLPVFSNVYVDGVFQHQFMREEWLKFIPHGSKPSPYVR